MKIPMRRVMTPGVAISCARNGDAIRECKRGGIVIDNCLLVLACES